MNVPSNYYGEPCEFDIEWIEANPHYPDWPKLVKLYQTGEIQPLADALRSAQYAPPPDVSRFLAEVASFTFRPPLRGKSNSLLTSDQRQEIATAVRSARHAATGATEESILVALHETGGRLPPGAEIERIRNDLLGFPDRLVSAYAALYGVSEALIRDIASKPRKRQ